MITSKLTIVIPNNDLAATTIWKYFSDSGLFYRTSEIFDEKPVYALTENPETKMVFSSKDGVKTDHLDQHIQTHFYIFASRHKSKSAIPALLIHSTGNWKEALLGGNESQLSYSSGFMIKTGLRKLNEVKEKFELSEYKVDLEVTHHGPTNLATPLCFMELGSSEKYWQDEQAAKAVGVAIIETAKTFLNQRKKHFISCVGFGGNHYAYQFQKYLERHDEIIISHIAPKFMIDRLTEDIIKQALDKTIETPEKVLIDKKGTKSAQRNKIAEIAEKMDKDHIFI